MGSIAKTGRSQRIYDAAMLGRAVTIAAASCLLLAACGDSDSDSDATTTTADPSTTTAVTTATTAAAPVVTTEAPSTTVDDEEALAAAEQAYLDAFDAYIAAARDPSNPDLRAEIERLYTGPNLEFTIDQLDGFVEQNWVARPGEEPSRTISCFPRSSCPTAPTSSSWSPARSTAKSLSKSAARRMGPTRSSLTKSTDAPRTHSASTSRWPVEVR